MTSVAAAAAGTPSVICAFAALLLAHVGLAAANATLQPQGWTPAAPAWGTCPTECRCRPEAREVSCRHAGMERVPATFLITTTPGVRRLDLTGNNITHVGENDLQGLDELEELVLADNALENVHPLALARVPHLKRLSLQNCGLLEVPWEALKSAPSLTTLILTGNALSSLQTAVQTPDLPALLVLVLRKNRLRSIEQRSFANLTSIRALELDDNLLSEIPPAITDLPVLQQLSLSNNRIRSIPSGLIQKCPQLALLELRGNPLADVHPDAFASLPHLRRLIVSDARDLTAFPNLNGTAALEILRLDRAALHEVPSSLCTTCPRLKSLDLKSNQLSRIPELGGCTELRLLELSGNQISTLEGQPFINQGRLHDLLLSHNKIPNVPEDAFKGLTKLQVLDLESNEIADIHPDAFTPFTQLEDLNLGNNIFPHLPERGLNRLLHLKTFNNPALREIPGPHNFPRVLTLALSYAYHCCAFLPLVQPTREDEDEPAGAKPKFYDTVVFPEAGAELDPNLWNTSSLADIWPQLQNLSKKFGPHFNELWDKFGGDFIYPSNLNLPSYMEDYFEEQERGIGAGSDQTRTFPGRVQCLPLPGPFLPCQDLFDWWTLRCGVWIVFLLAMLGNGTVVFVLVFSRSKMDVPRFLVCNLAMADFFMGIYLGFLAVVDASTLGEFRMYAIPWQMSAGCQLAGFLGVLSCELSVYTLAVITLERNYAITHAMHLNKRLSLKHAGYIMAAGWAFSLAMAVLPLVGGVSDYRKFAVCLPFETKGAASLAYVVFLMFINGVAFLILMGCYLKMYCAIRGSQAWNSNDSRIAKRMALLVFTDFLCWSPIAFFSLTAAFGLQLVSLEQAKVFTVFVLPLNSCCNPFLYAILTKQFKKDCVLICKAIEESRVTRGIGRCRHSSNFSNRQTPANTNSLVDRSSREHGAPCACNAGNNVTPTGKLLPQNPRSRISAPAASARGGTGARGARHWFLGKVSWLLCHREAPRGARSDQYAYQIAEIQQKQHKRASSVSSENFSSSRSDSWRAAHHHCGIPLRLLDPKRRSSWAVTRKTSQDSNLSSSRNDSSATSASTSTWRMSRSSASGSEVCGVPVVTRPLLSGVAPPVLHLPHGGGITSSSPLVPPLVLPPPLQPAPLQARAKPRLTRQSAVVQADCNSDADSPPPGGRGLMVRFLATIPSAAETSEIGQDSGSSDSSAPGSPVPPSQQTPVNKDNSSLPPC